MKNPAKQRTLKTVMRTLTALFVLLCWFVAATSTATSLQDERKLEDKIPQHVPVKIKLKNLQSEKWARDLEVEVTNTGDKPIYYLQLILVLPETKSTSGIPMGFPFEYGRGKMVDINERAVSEDVPLNPGESHIFKIEEKVVKGWEIYEADPDNIKPQRFKVIFSVLNFGDGTGFLGTDGNPIPNKRASKSSCGQRGKGNVAGMGTINSPPDLFIMRSTSLPVSFLPAIFLPDKVKDASPTSPAIQGELFCCPGSACNNMKVVEGGYNCQCGSRDDVSPIACRDTSGQCGKLGAVDTTCVGDYGYVYHCPRFYIVPCGSLDTE